MWLSWLSAYAKPWDWSLVPHKSGMVAAHAYSVSSWEVEVEG